MVRVWEYDVSETSRAEFERTYGAAGDWVQLFSSSDGFRGTELFVSLSDPGRYLTVDRFTDEGAWRACHGRRAAVTGSSQSGGSSAHVGATRSSNGTGSATSSCS